VASGKRDYLELRPIHSHVYAVIVGPPFEIFLVIGIIYRVIEFLIYLWKPENIYDNNRYDNSDNSVICISNLKERKKRNRENLYSLYFVTLSRIKLNRSLELIKQR
jgi:hypothetical protein